MKTYFSVADKEHGKMASTMVASVRTMGDIHSIFKTT